MPCIDNKVWNAARIACAARTASVRGFGYVTTGLRGLGDLNINTSTTDPNDPCVIASQTPCPVFSTPASYVPPTSVTMQPGTPVQSTSASAGFSRWGLLAALAAGGGVLYLVMKKKGAS